MNPVLRAVANAISAQMTPELESALAKDAANFGSGLLRGALLEQLSKQRIADYEQSLREMMIPALGSPNASRDHIGAWIENLYLQPGMERLNATNILAGIAREEKLLQAGIRADDEAENQRATVAAKLVQDKVNEDSVTAYLNQKLNRTDITVSNIRLIPGGGSKITRFVSLNPVHDLPAEIIMRQDYAVNHVGNSIIDEYPLIGAMHDAGLPVAAPILMEPDPLVFGAPFMLVQKVEGQNIGNLWGFFPNTEPKPVLLELAQLLARIHALAPGQYGLPSTNTNVSLRDRVLQQISEIHGKWASGRRNTSPVIALSLLWLAENIDTTDATPTLVHADCAFTNILVHEGNISALLDWEFAHVGDPAEDLAYVKDVVEQVMPWQEFVDVYCAAGGKAPSAHRLHYFNVWRALRNAIYAGLAGASFLRGGNNNLMLGWAGIYAAPMLEHQLMQMLGDAWEQK